MSISVSSMFGLKISVSTWKTFLCLSKAQHNSSTKTHQIVQFSYNKSIFRETLSRSECDPTISKPAQRERRNLLTPRPRLRRAETLLQHGGNCSNSGRFEFVIFVSRGQTDANAGQVVRMEGQREVSRCS